MADIKSEITAASPEAPVLPLSASENKSLRELWRPVNKQMKETILRTTSTAETTEKDMQELLKATESLAIELNVDTSAAPPVLLVQNDQSEMIEVAKQGLQVNSAKAIADPWDPSRAAALPPAPIVALPAKLRGQFIRDVTIPDGHVLPPGAEFVKVWRMRNEGDHTWPASTELRFTTGTNFSGIIAMPVGEVLPGAYVDVETSELKAPDQPGRYISYWHLSDGQGQFFGSSIWMDITVAEMNKSDGANSLASSAVVMPYSAQARSTVGDNLHVASSIKPSTNHVTSIGGSSVGSSVSLISAPPSDNEDDAAWEDSRTQAIQRPNEAGSQAMNYVVLYDDDSESENGA